MLYAGGGQGLYFTDDCGGSWHLQAVPSGITRRVRSVAVSIDGQDRLYAYNGRDPLIVSSDSGKTWRQASGLLPDGKRIPLLYANIDAASAATDGPAFAWSFADYTAEHTIFPIAEWRSDDGGEIWRPLGGRWRAADGSEDSSVEPRISAVSPTDPNVIYSVSRVDGPRRSRDGGGSYESFIQELRPELASDEFITQLRISADASRLWLLTSRGRVYTSIDDGATWDAITDISANLPLMSIVSNPLDPDSIFGLTRTQSGGSGGVLWLYR